MAATVLDGNALAKTIREEVKAGVAELSQKRGVTPGLAAVLVGDNPASEFYVRAKRRDCEGVGIRSSLHRLPAAATQSALLDLVSSLNADSDVHGILVQLPLPRQMDEAEVILSIRPLKDVDAFHPVNVGLLTAGHPRYLPCTPYGVQQLLARNGLATTGKRVVVLGRSNIVGKPLALMLMQKPTADNPAAGDATVTVCHSRTPDLAAVCREADILVAAVGRPKFLTADMVKPGAVVIDVGISKVGGQDKPVGDVDYDAVAAVAGAITPVPGGVGPMTRAMLLVNTLAAAKLQTGG